MITRKGKLLISSLEREVFFILLSENLTTTWTPQNRKRYESLGYIFTKYGDKFSIDFKDATIGMRDLVDVKCDYCGKEYPKQYQSFINGRKHGNTDACSKCAARKQRSLDREKRAKHAFDKLNKILEEKNYILLTSIDEYTDEKMDISYICPMHGIQHISMDSLLHGHKCRECAKISVGDKNRTPVSIIDSYIKSKGGKWLNPHEYKNKTTHNLKVECSCGNSFTTTWANFQHHSVFRCSSCSQKESIAELCIREYLTENNINYIQEVRFDDCRDIKPLPFDFYLPKYNLIIEFDGQQHFQPIYGHKALDMIQRHDKIKNEYCQTNDIELLRISYLDGHYIEDIIQNKLDDISRRNSLVS